MEVKKKKKSTGISIKELEGQGGEWRNRGDDWRI